MWFGSTTPGSWRRSGAWLVAGAVLIGAALAVGIDDNLPGVALLYGGGTALVLAFTHPLRTTRQFRRLALGAVAMFAVSVVLHNVLEVGAQRIGVETVVGRVLDVVQTAFFLAAVLLCPIALVVAVIGWVGAWRRERGGGAGG